MSAKPSLSIITPVRNGANFIERCIQNVIRQNCAQAEHIIIDGASTDGTQEIIKKYASQYNHIRFLSEADKGQSDAMNKGIKLAYGPVISFLNADDFYEPDTFSYIINLFKNALPDTFLFGKCRVFDELNNKVSINNPRSIQLKYLLSTRNFPNNPSAYFYHKSLHARVGYYNENEHYAMDIEFILKISTVAKPLRVDRILGNFNLMPGTKTFESLIEDKAIQRINELCGQHLKKLNLIERAEVFLRFKYSLINYYIRRIKSLFKKTRLEPPYEIR
jgi:glycosyltransferase involved in cell wall biosynthesis